MAASDRTLEDHKAWIAQVSESALEPDLPICDPHHHLWLDNGHTGWPYTLADFHDDTSAGHNIVRSIFLECHAEYLDDGPEHLRSVGEVAFIADLAEQSANSGKTEIAGIIGNADLGSRPSESRRSWQRSTRPGGDVSEVCGTQQPPTTIRRCPCTTTHPWTVQHSSTVCEP